MKTLTHPIPKPCTPTTQSSASPTKTTKSHSPRRFPGMTWKCGALLMLEVLIHAPNLSAEPVLIRRPKAEQVWSVAWSPDGRQLAVGSTSPSANPDALNEGTVELYDVNSGRLLQTLRLSAKTDFADCFNRVGSVQFSPDGKRLLAHDDRSYVLWNPESSKIEKRWLDLYLDPKTSPDWSRDGRKLALPISSLETNAPSLRIVDLAAGTEETIVSVETGFIITARFSPDGSLVATAGQDGFVRVMDLKSKAALWSEAVQTVLYAVCFSPDGSELAAGSVSLGMILRYEISREGGRVGVRKGEPSATTREELHRVEYLPDGKHAVSISHLGMRIWDTKDWQQSVAWPDCRGWISQDGRRIAVARGNSPAAIEVWSFEEFGKTA
ncbi:MAG: hypothetical protein RIS76_434 [Verrucomicrobiota bacterium]